MKTSTRTSRFLAWIILFVLWAILAQLVNNELYLPGPLSTLRALAKILAEKDSYIYLAFSFFRVALGLLLALVLGSLLGLLTGFSQLARLLLSPLESLLRSVPVVSFIMLALLWLGSGGVPIFIAFLMSLPIFWSAVEASVREADPRLLEMMEVFSLSFSKRLRAFYLPWAGRYLELALKQSIGLAWKAGVAAEVLSYSPLSIGRKIQESKVFLETADLFSWTLLLLILSFTLERMVDYGAKRRKL